MLRLFPAFAELRALQDELAGLKSTGAEASNLVTTLRTQLREWEQKHSEEHTRAESLQSSTLHHRPRIQPATLCFFLSLTPNAWNVCLCAGHHTIGVQQLQAELAALRSSGAQASDQVTALQSELREWQSKCTEQSTRADTLQAELTAAQQQLAAVTQQLSECQGRLQAASASSEQVAQAAKATEESLRAQLATLSQEQSESATALATTRAQNQELSAKISAVSSQCAQLTAERDQMKRKYDALQAGSASTARAAATVAQSAKVPPGCPFARSA